MSISEMTTEQIRRRGLETLLRELGAEGAMRFLELTVGDRDRCRAFIRDVGLGEVIDLLQELVPGAGDYTREKQEQSRIGIEPDRTQCSNAPIDLQAIYDELTLAAVRREVVTFRQLSDFYWERTEQWHDPVRAWNGPLTRLNGRLHAAGYPPLSVVVVNENSRTPYDGFWGSAPSVPSRPDSDEERILEYRRILQRVHETKWPAKLPGADEESK